MAYHLNDSLPHGGDHQEAEIADHERVIAVSLGSQTGMQQIQMAPTSSDKDDGSGLCCM